MPGQAFSIESDVPLAPYTTIGLGGKARYFASCTTAESIREGLRHAVTRSLRVHVLGGGSNTVFADRGFDGLVLKIDLRGIIRDDHGQAVHVRVAAGEPWDSFVQQCTESGLGGIECLSGIPGLTGATPIQNVGAYGQEVAETILRVRALERSTLEDVVFARTECQFGYRMSRFKSMDADRYVILEVEFSLQKNAPPTIRYPELRHAVDSALDLASLPPGRDALSAVRTSVLALRRGKSMVIDPADPNTKSVGSFFMNPVVSVELYNDLQQRWRTLGGTGEVPGFVSGSQRKLSAAWLVEKAGFSRGFKKGSVGVSANHSLALVNYGGSAQELLALASEVQDAVARKFGIQLQREPVVVP
jgi:UDP-N-acetylmuramate dehydrogenase